MELPEFRDVTKERMEWSGDKIFSIAATGKDYDSGWDKHTVVVTTSPTGNCQSTTISGITYLLKYHDLDMAKAIFVELVENYVPTTCVLLDVLERDIESTKELLKALDTHEIILEAPYVNTTNSPMSIIIASIIPYDPDEEEGDYDEEEECDDMEWEDED